MDIELRLKSHIFLRNFYIDYDELVNSKQFLREKIEVFKRIFLDVGFLLEIALFARIFSNNFEYFKSYV